MGRLEKNASMKKYTWLSVGGAAQCVFHPDSISDLTQFIKDRPFADFKVIGAGSNILVRDGPLDACVIRINKGFDGCVIQGETIEVGAGLFDKTFALICEKAGLSGFEFLGTIPGTIGGGIAMNAGCYGGEVCDRLEWIEILDSEGGLHRLHKHELHFTYRSCILPKESIIIKAGFKGTQSTPQSIRALMDQQRALRDKTQPTKVKTGGSTFKNPSTHSAWDLVDKAGFRGATLGGAQFSEKHCNFLINHGHACAKDLEDLAEMARNKIYGMMGILLEWEIVRWGRSL